MVINTCVALGEENPIAMIHDVGAGGLSNALPELVKDALGGGKFELRQVASVDDKHEPASDLVSPLHSSVVGPFGCI